jgi:hypothetical protein
MQSYRYKQEDGGGREKLKAHEKTQTDKDKGQGKTQISTILAFLPTN